jgi:hypothetical protein
MLMFSFNVLFFSMSIIPGLYIYTEVLVASIFCDIDLIHLSVNYVIRLESVIILLISLVYRY